jgi:addiction module HigA family antidote
MAITTDGKGMHNPAHPGEILDELYLHPMRITQAEAAAALGVSVKHVSAITNGHVPVTPQMAMRIALATGTECALWVNLQAQYDIWQISQQPKPKVKPLRAA